MMWCDESRIKRIFYKKIQYTNSLCLCQSSKLKKKVLQYCHIFKNISIQWMFTVCKLIYIDWGNMNFYYNLS